ncbi:ankyrin repeat-containing protein [Tanacetum coccineum]
MNSTSKEIAEATPSEELVKRKSLKTFDMGSMEYISGDDDPVNLPRTFWPHEENRADYFEFGVPLYEASLNGDWETAKLILDKRPELVRFGICRQLGTALHVAATAEETKLTLQFVQNLVNMMTREELELRNQFSNTAFWIASATGNVNMAMVMMEKNPSLQYIRGANSLLPLAKSASGGKYKIVKYLYDVSQKMIGNHWTNEDRASVLVNCVKRELFDLALQIVNDLPELAATVSVLEVLARKPDAFTTSEKNIVMRIIDPVISPVLRFFRMKVQSAAKEDTDALKLLKIIWRRVCETMYIDEIEVMLKGPPRILFVAAETGNTRFIVECLRTYPDLMFDKNDDGLTIFHIAVLHRRQGVYNLMYEIGSAKLDICLTTDKMYNNMLHLVGKSSKEMTAKMAKASLLMQREVLWFKEIEKMMPPYLTDMKNKNGLTAYELFSKENEDQVSSGLKWMNECMIVDTLLVAVAFAVAFTVPGGYRQDNGFPFFLHQISYLVFVIADGVSLLLSAISLLVFLSVLTSRYGPRDFMYSLPSKLMIGLLGLVISVGAMTVTFTASFFMLYHNGLSWLPILCAIFAPLPAIVFVVLQYPILIDMYRSTYDSRYLFNPKKRMLYNIKPKFQSSYPKECDVGLLKLAFITVGIHTVPLNVNRFSECRACPAGDVSQPACSFFNVSRAMGRKILWIVWVRILCLLRLIVYRIPASQKEYFVVLRTVIGGNTLTILLPFEEEEAELKLFSKLGLGGKLNTASRRDKSWKVRFLVFLDGLEPYLLKTLEDGPFIPLSNLSTSTNPLPKPQNQLSHAKARLANQDKRLKSIIISCLPNDAMKAVIKCKTAKAMWNDLILAHEGPYDTRDTKIATLRLKFNAFIALEDVEEDLRSSREFIDDLNVEYHERDLLANHKRLYKRSGRVGSDKGITKIKAFMAIAEEEMSVGRADARPGQWVEITMKKALGRRGKRKKKISSNELIFTKADESSSVSFSEITPDSVSECTTNEPLPPLHKLIGAKPVGTSNNVISLADLTLNMADLTLDISIPKRTNPTSDKVSPSHANKKNTETKSPVVPIPHPEKKTDSSDEQLLLTLIEEVKSLKEQIKVPSDNSPSVSQTRSSKSSKGKQTTWFGPCKHYGFKNHLAKDCYIKPKCSTCGSTDHLTKEHYEQTAVNKTLTKLKAQSSVNSSAKKAPMIPKPFKVVNTVDSMTIIMIIVNTTLGVKYVVVLLMKHPTVLRSTPITENQGLLTSDPQNPLKSGFTKETNLCDTKGYDSVNCNRITFTRVAYVNGLKHTFISISQLCDANFKVLFTKTQGTIFNQNDKVVLIAPRRRDVYVIDMSSYNEESNAYKNYSACEKGKHHRASFKTKRSFSINKCLHLLHMDLCGPVKPQTISHNKYTLVIVDEYSRYTWVFCLQNKSDACDCIMSFIRKMENVNELSVKELRSDNGNEFRNHKLKEFYDEKGISQNFSSPCTLEQNGVAERRNKTLIEGARTMLNSAKLPKQFWGEAVNTACYTQNISIIVKRHGKTAYDVFRGRSRDISTSMCLGVLCIFTITETTWESLMKRLMMDSFLVTLQWPKHSGYLTSKDKKWKKHIMLHSVKMMKQFLNPAQKVMQSTSMNIDPSLMMNSLNLGVTPRQRRKHQNAT